MNKYVVVIYLIWAFMLIGVGIYVMSKTHDTTDPSSLSSSMKKFKEAIDEDSKISE
jgi:hypothetical protein